MTGRRLRQMHGWLMVAWTIATPPLLIWWRESVAVVVAVSLYTVIVDHWGAWQAARVEAKQDEAG